jgi:hypothetical protein
MIARVFAPGASFGRTCQYVAEDLTRAQVIWQEGVRGHDYRLAARDFEMIAALRDTISKPVFHAVLTFHRDEKLDTGQKVGLALRYLEGVGMVNTQRLICEHFDARHQHLHLVANRIDFDGEPIHNFPEVLRSRETVERLVREHGLVPVAAKDMRQTNYDALDASDMRRYAIYRAVKECLPGCRNMEELGQRLLKMGVETRYRADPATGQRTGVSFFYQNEAFSGSKIDRELSLGRLERTLARRQELRQWEEQKLQMQKTHTLEQERALKQRQAFEEEQRQERKLNQEETQEPRLRQRPRLRI